MSWRVSVNLEEEEEDDGKLFKLLLLLLSMTGSRLLEDAGVKLVGGAVPTDVPVVGAVEGIGDIETMFVATELFEASI